jgi:hypothetical protein
MRYAHGPTMRGQTKVNGSRSVCFYAKDEPRNRDRLAGGIAGDSALINFEDIANAGNPGGWARYKSASCVRFGPHWLQIDKFASVYCLLTDLPRLE